MIFNLVKLFQYYFWLFGFKSIKIFLDKTFRYLFSSSIYESIHHLIWYEKSYTPSCESELKVKYDFIDYYPNLKKQQIIESAENICHHIFNFLGTDKVEWGKDIKWNFDIKSGYSWDPKFYSFYKQNELMPSNGIDIKTPWELNRLHHLVTLCQAYKLTNDKKYILECLNQYNDWSNKNPFCYGINWTSAMEVSIRAVNLVLILDIVCTTDKWVDKDIISLKNKIREHGVYIMYNLEIGVSKNDIVAGNHYLANVAALSIIGMSLRDIPESESWLKCGMKGLEDAMKWMVNNDGFYFESSTSYHRFSIELFMYPYIFGLLTNNPFSMSYSKKLQLMLDVILYLNTPGNTIPQIGDNDNGRLLILDNYPNWITNDHRYLLGMGSVLFNRSDYKFLSENFSLELLWFFGKKSLQNYNNIKSKKISILSKSFPDSGLYVIRNDKRKDYTLVKGCSKSHSLYGHMHNDVLSLELWVDGKPLFIDPGSYCYTSDIKERNYFRSTKRHSTLIINDKELNEMGSEAFKIEWKTNFKCNQWEISKNNIKFVGEHNAYYENFGYIVRRTIIYQDSNWTLKDEIIGDGTDLQSVQNRWVFPPEISNIDKRSANKYIINDEIVLKFKDSSSILIEDTLYSLGYGIQKKTKTLVNSLNKYPGTTSVLKIFQIEK